MTHDGFVLVMGGAIGGPWGQLPWAPGPALSYLTHMPQVSSTLLPLALPIPSGP